MAVVACRLQVLQLVCAAECDCDDVINLGGYDGAAWSADLALAFVALQALDALLLPLGCGAALGTYCSGRVLPSVGVLGAVAQRWVDEG
ncbi:hypothetical protein PP626_23455 [Mycobacteroides abscessus]|nr:hypothetical protein [Mycobacteroides abscessus]MDM2694849.1 hypothetical protein [Mycobacteroides abscessus]MDM2700016.1 hypothetical protein [Mycobacteroides abscessus]MDM2704820.1 hypothetical protein [Mycobacteroides abscessus]MDO3264551.1 hypothetical protein [Mycobacteroides abscessus subsp. abscessus]